MTERVAAIGEQAPERMHDASEIVDAIVRAMFTGFATTRNITRESPVKTNSL